MSAWLSYFSTIRSWDGEGIWPAHVSYIWRKPPPVVDNLPDEFEPGEQLRELTFWLGDLGKED